MPVGILRSEEQFDTKTVPPHQRVVVMGRNVKNFATPQALTAKREDE